MGILCRRTGVELLAHHNARFTKDWDNLASARFRLMCGQRISPAREVHAGSGYWSQDSALQVMTPAPLTQIRVRWPGGHTITSEIPTGAKAIKAGTDGKLSVLR